jgi:hypothetical protein
LFGSADINHRDSQEKRRTGNMNESILDTINDLKDRIKRLGEYL